MEDQARDTVRSRKSRRSRRGEAHAGQRSRLLRRVAAACGLALLVLEPAAAGNLQVDGSFVSTAPTGTPPLAVASTTQVEHLNADLLDGLDSSDFAPAPENLLWVSPSGTEFATVQAALDSITDASASNRYLVRVGPGIFTEPVTMKPFVDVQGSGQDVTILRAFVAGAVVTGASNATLRDLTVENYGGSFGSGKGIHNSGAATRIVRVTVRVEAGYNAPIGIQTDGSPPFPGPLLQHVTVSAQGPRTRGIQTEGSRITISDSQVTASGKHAQAIANSGGAVARLTRVDAQASHGDAEHDTSIYGIWTSESEVEMVDVDVRTLGGFLSAGVYVENGTARALMRRVLVFAHGGGGERVQGVVTIETPLDVLDSDIQAVGTNHVTRALRVQSANVRVYRSKISATGGSSAYGLSDQVTFGTGGTSTFTVEVHASQLWGSTRPVNNNADFTVRIGASSLGGAFGVYDPTGSSVICAGIYDESFTFHADTCF